MPGPRPAIYLEELTGAERDILQAVLIAATIGSSAAEFVARSERLISLGILQVDSRERLRLTVAGERLVTRS